MLKIARSLESLTKEELVSLINELYQVVSGTKVNLATLDDKIKSIVESLAKAKDENRVAFMEDFIADLESINTDKDVMSLAYDVQTYVNDRFLRQPLKKCNVVKLAEKLEERLDQLDELSINEILQFKLLELLELLSNQETKEEQINMNSYPAIVEGLARTYVALDNTRKIAFLNHLDYHYEYLYKERISAISVAPKKQQLNSLLSSVDKLSVEGQSSFYDDAYYLLLGAYNRIAEEERKRNCEHKFGK